MSNSNSSKQVLLSVIGVAILVVAVVGVSFAFFNYTRTGTANTIRTGQIFFTQSHSSVSLTNVFPVSSADVLAVPGTSASPVSNPSVGFIDITVNGYTTYSNGVDFTVSAVNVVNHSQVGASYDANTDVTIPFTVEVSSSGFDDNTKATITTSSYGPGLGANGADNILTEGDILATGKIKSGGSTNNNFTGHIYVKAYLDASKVAITDTYDPTSTEEVIDPETNQPVTTHKPTDQNGTTADWVAGRTVLTTDQWNSLANHPVSFQVRVVAEEGAA